MAIEPELQAQVDAQLMEQGAFAPLDLLFNSGRLIYSDYESWRRREMDLLDDVLMGDRGKILAELERAAAEFGYRAVRLETGIYQAEAIALYESSGYRRIPAFGHYVGSAISVCYEKLVSGGE